MIEHSEPFEFASRKAWSLPLHTESRRTKELKIIDPNRMKPLTEIHSAGTLPQIMKTVVVDDLISVHLQDTAVIRLQVKSIGSGCRNPKHSFEHSSETVGATRDCKSHRRCNSRSTRCQSVKVRNARPKTAINTVLQAIRKTGLGRRSRSGRR